MYPFVVRHLKQYSPLVLLALFLTMPSPAISGTTTPAVPATAKCPVCGMFVAKYPDWLATLRCKDGTTYYYDGPKDMFSHYLEPGRYTPKRSQAEIVALTVKDYYSLAPLDARSAWYVTGSDVYGPMGHELVPFRSEKDARDFKTDHKGTRILRFTDITRAIIATLN